MINIVDLSHISDRFRRSENQDRFIVLKGINSSTKNGDMAILAVFDGISNSNGYSSSIMAADEVYPILCGLLPQLCRYNDSETDEYITDTLKNAILAADKKLCSESYTDINTGFKVKYGTTVSVAVLCRDKLYTANIGDSPIFLLNLSDRENIQLLEAYTSHNKAGEKVRRGEITEEQATADDKRRLVRYAGYGLEENDISAGWVPLPFQSMLLIGSDGALSVCRKDELAELADFSLDFTSSAAKLSADLYRKIYEQTRSTDNFTLISALIRQTKE